MPPTILAFLDDIFLMPRLQDIARDHRMEAPEEQGYLYRALLQLTVALLHLEFDNTRGAKKMMLHIHQWLDLLPAICRNVNVATLKYAVAALRNNHREGASSAPDLRSNQIKLVS
jgi:predicted metal-dependent hydrolase